MVYTNVSDYMGTRSGYKLIGSHMYIHLCTYGTTGGSASNTIFATIPFNTGLDYQVLSGCLNDGGSYQTAYVSIGNDNKISCCHYILSSNWGLGEPREMMINGVIELTC